MKMTKPGEIYSRGTNTDHREYVAETIELLLRLTLPVPSFLYDLDRMLANKPWQLLKLSQVQSIEKAREPLNEVNILNLESRRALAITDPSVKVTIEGLVIPFYNV